VTKITEKENRIGTKEQSAKRSNRMSFFKCSCGAKILVIPDLYLMGQTIKRHIMEHYRLSGRRFTDETLTEILKTLYTQM